MALLLYVLSMGPVCWVSMTINHNVDESRRLLERVCWPITKAAEWGLEKTILSYLFPWTPMKDREVIAMASVGGISSVSSYTDLGCRLSVVAAVARKPWPS